MHDGPGRIRTCDFRLESITLDRRPVRRAKNGKDVLYPLSYRPIPQARTRLWTFQLQNTHRRTVGDHLALGPGSRVRLTPQAWRPRRPAVECSNLRDRSVVKQRFLPAFGRPARMQIAPPGGRRAGGAIRFAPSSLERCLRRSLGPRATCGVIAVVVSADLLAFRLDPQTVRRDTTRVESRDRARARLAKTSRAEISEWEVDGRFHTSPFNESSIGSRAAGSAIARGHLRCLARPPDGATSHIENESRAAMLSLAVRCTVEVTHPRRARRAEEHRDATPRAGTLASTVLVVK